ncbi:hypothetical protein CEXT_642961 [Caerostris extrusa]|uniref:Uncharacterized protein n=1 Tax=Caerostris extrusa TaxID=172846 RepID=A0AAV4X0H4_CAEEX|nr:hypothetical protein CEXT_642961 [Caerostris extrusa]
MQAEHLSKPAESAKFAFREMLQASLIALANRGISCSHRNALCTERGDGDLTKFRQRFHCRVRGKGKWRFITQGHNQLPRQNEQIKDKQRKIKEQRPLITH